MAVYHLYIESATGENAKPRALPAILHLESFVFALSSHLIAMATTCTILEIAEEP